VKPQTNQPFVGTVIAVVENGLPLEGWTSELAATGDVLSAPV
jgi:hypothetical protein